MVSTSRYCEAKRLRPSLALEIVSVFHPFRWRFAMLAKRFAEIIVLLSIVTSLSTNALAQNTQDCRTKKDIPLISGHWKDDQTGKEVDITQQSNKVVATYSETHNCKNPDKEG